MCRFYNIFSDLSKLGDTFLSLIGLENIQYSDDVK